MQQAAFPTELVDRAELERHLARLVAEHPEVGVYGPGSINWKVGRESLLLLAGGRAALLQVAHPYVAHAVATHSKVFTQVQLRFQRTLSYVYAMTFGTLDHARRLARRVHRLHEHVEGVLDEDLGRFRRGQVYRANEPHALLWVAATLWDTSLDIFERVVGPLTPAERERYYQESRQFCRLFGIPDAIIPPNWEAFRRYWSDMLAGSSLAVGGAARQIATSIFTPPRPLAGPSYALIRVLTTGLLPPRLRREFDLPWGGAERAAFASTLVGLRLTIPRLPAPVRFVPTYLRAVRRLEGKSGPDPVADAMRRLSLTLLKTPNRAA